MCTNFKKYRPNFQINNISYATKLRYIVEIKHGILVKTVVIVVLSSVQIQK